MPSVVSINALAERLRMLEGWRRYAAAFAAGAASVLAMAPFFVWPVLWLTLPALVWLIDGACIRAAFDTLAPSPRNRRRHCRLVVRLRLFPGRAVLDRRGVPRRGGGFRLVAPSGGHAAPWRPCPVLCRRGRHRGAVLAGRAEPRLGAGANRVGHGVGPRACLHRPALECAGLRAHLPPPADAKCSRPRHLRPHACSDPHICPAAGAVGRGASRLSRPSYQDCGHGHCSGAARRCCSPWPGAPGAGAAGFRAGRQDPHRPAERTAAREMASREPAAHLPRSHGAVGRQCHGRGRRSRRHHGRDLAGSCHALPAARLPRRARRHRAPAAAVDPPDHRRAARRAGAAGLAPAAGACSTASSSSGKADR